MKRIVTFGIVGLLVLAAAAAGGWWWLSHRGLESTENAFVQADTVQVAPQVAGYVAEVLVTDNQEVQVGQPLVRLDAAEAEARLAQAEANVGAAVAATRNVGERAQAEQALISERAAAVQTAQAQARLAEADLQRYEQLARQGWVSAQRAQTAEAQAAQARAAVSQAQAALEAERRATAAFGSSREQSAATAEQARAAVRQARINVDRQTVRAPVAGVVGARAVRVGQYVQPGQMMLAIVPLGRTYVVANFKETQVGSMRVGQPVEIEADAFPGHTFRGRIESFAPATGSEFALIPVENATGNFTKIVQRVPVRIAVDERDPLAAGLRPGLSLSIVVDTRTNTGLSFAEASARRAARTASR